MDMQKNEQAKATNNCTNPPHFPPHCGCPAGVAPRPLWLSPQASQK